MTRPVINISEIEPEPFPARMTPSGATAEKFEARLGYIAPLLGARQLGYNLTVVPPGKRAFPLHSHRVNEEMFFVLEGRGEVRIGGDVYPLRPGDIIACPAGGPETAHQIVNTGENELRFLAVSTKISPEVCEYPESGKFGVYAEFAAALGEAPQRFGFLGRPKDSLGYWDDE
jgi:uncharacterized cupin superfamily protein